MSVGDRGESARMNLGYDQSLYMLAFDHRASFQKGIFGIEGTPTSEQRARIGQSKLVIFEGLRRAVEEFATAFAARKAAQQWIEGARVTKLVLGHGRGGDRRLQHRRAGAPLGIATTEHVLVVGQGAQ